jgi:hypothetical protein
MMGADADEADDSGQVNALFCTMACLFDRICDVRPDLLPSLLKRSGKGAVLKGLALSGEEEEGEPIFRACSEDPVELAVLLLVMEEYFLRCRSVILRGNRGPLGEEFSRTIFFIYEAELRSVELRFERQPWSPEIHEHLRNKSSLPAWATFLTSAMVSSIDLGGDLALFRETVLKLGDVFWIIDDVIDTVDDLENGRWSYTWLRLADLGIDLTARGDPAARCERLLQELLAGEVVASSMTDLVAGLKGLEEMTILLGGCPSGTVQEFRRILLADLRSTFEFL